MTIDHGDMPYETYKKVEYETRCPWCGTFYYVYMNVVDPTQTVCQSCGSVFDVEENRKRGIGMSESIKQWQDMDAATQDKYLAWGFNIENMEEGEFIFRDKYGNLMKAKQGDVTLSVEKSQAFDRIEEVMALPETTQGETFRKLAKVKEIVEGME